MGDIVTGDNVTVIRSEGVAVGRVNYFYPIKAERWEKEGTQYVNVEWQAYSGRFAPSSAQKLDNLKQEI